MIAFHVLQIRKNLCDIFFCSQDIGKRLVNRFSLTEHIFFYSAKSVQPLEFE